MIAALLAFILKAHLQLLGSTPQPSVDRLASWRHLLFLFLSPLYDARMVQVKRKGLYGSVMECMYRATADRCSDPLGDKTVSVAAKLSKQ